MNDQGQTTPDPRDTPEQRQRAARLLLILSPAMFMFCLVLARLQGAPSRDLLIIASAGFVMCLVFAAHHKLRGGQSPNDLFWLNVVFSIFRR